MTVIKSRVEKNTKISQSFLASSNSMMMLSSIVLNSYILWRTKGKYVSASIIKRFKNIPNMKLIRIKTQLAYTCTWKNFDSRSKFKSTL